jgi:hypothetical protein
MATEPHSTKHEPTHEHGAVEMPEPTVAPLVLALGMAMFAAGVLMGPAFLIIGGLVLLYGLGMWISNLLPGRGHTHEPLVAPEHRPQPVKRAIGGVQELRPGMAGYRVRVPEKLHPISAGIKGGLAGGAVLPIPAFLWAILTGHSIVYPINLLAGMMMPGMGDVDLEQFNFTLFLSGAAIHVITSVILGMLYGVLLPTLPAIPQAMAWGALLAPILWTGATFVLMGMANPKLREGVSWPWFILSQFIYGIVMTLIVTQATGLKPGIRGAVGGLVGGALMPAPALIWSLGTGKGFFYPANLLAGMVIPGHNDPTASEMIEFHADWLAIAMVMHLVFSVGFGVACDLFLPRLKPIPSPFAWGAMLMPMMWTAVSFTLMGVLNPVLQREVDWPWFIISQFTFGIAAAIVVVRSEQITVPPAGSGTTGAQGQANWVTG